MYDYSCKNCNNIIGKWNYKYKWYDCLNFCNYFNLYNDKFIYFLNCRNCNKFIGIVCVNVCINCFGEDEIVGEKKLFNWFLKYKKLQLKYINYKFSCKNCNKQKFRWQPWFFEELTFYK